MSAPSQFGSVPIFVGVFVFAFILYLWLRTHNAKRKRSQLLINLRSTDPTVRMAALSEMEAQFAVRSTDVTDDIELAALLVLEKANDIMVAVDTVGPMAVSDTNCDVRDKARTLLKNMADKEIPKYNTSTIFSFPETEQLNHARENLARLVKQLAGEKRATTPPTLSAVATVSQAASNPMRPIDEKLRAVVECFGRGDATAISVFSSSQEANARAQAKLFASWAATSGCKLKVQLIQAITATEHKQFLLVKIGSQDSQWNLTKSLRTTEFRKLQSEVLTSEENASISPVSCYENFPQPGCSLIPSGTLKQIVEQIRQGEYNILEIPVSPSLKKPSTFPTAQPKPAQPSPSAGGISSLVPNLNAFIQEERARVDNDPDLVLQCYDYENMFKAMAGLAIISTESLPAKATQHDALSADKAVSHMAFLLAQAIAQDARLEVESATTDMLIIRAGAINWHVGRTGTNEFRVWLDN